MPLRLDALMKSNTDVFTWIVGEELDKMDDVYATNDKKYLLGTTALCDARTGNKIGKYVFTILNDEKNKRLEILDLDIVLHNEKPILLELCDKHPESSDSNEYYDAAVVGDSGHLLVETVNRHIIEADIVETEQQVYLSAFPFALSVYDDMTEINHLFGMDKEIEVGDTGLKVGGLSETFIAPAIVASGDKDDDKLWTFVVGTVKSFSEVTIAFGENKYDAFIVTLDTAVGELPTMVGKENFDTSNLAAGKTVGMKACIKANFIQGAYPKCNSRE